MDRYDVIDGLDEVLPRRWKVRLMRVILLAAAALTWLGFQAPMDALVRTAAGVAQHRSQLIVDRFLGSFKFPTAPPTPLVPATKPASR